MREFLQQAWTLWYTVAAFVVSLTGVLSLLVRGFGGIRDDLRVIRRKIAAIIAA